MTLGTNIDALGGRALTVSEAARACRVNPATIWRWRVVGVRGVKLESVQLGGRTLIPESAMQRFIERLNDTGTNSAQAELERRALAARV